MLSRCGYIIACINRMFKQHGIKWIASLAPRKLWKLSRLALKTTISCFQHYTMPDINGLEMIEQIKRIRPDIKAVLMSGASDKLEYEATDDNRPDAWLSKPFKVNDLVNALSKLTSRNLETRS